MVKRALPILAVAALLAGCGGGTDDDATLSNLDAELTGNTVDPQLSSALEGQIMVDPDLAQQSNDRAVRPGEDGADDQIPADRIADGGETRRGAGRTGDLQRTPAATGATSTDGRPVTLGALADRQQSLGSCASQLQYSAQWAARMPQPFTVYPGGHVDEAAGATGACDMRVVSFWSGDELQRVMDWYYTQARRAGFSADHQTDRDGHVLGGTQGARAFVVFLSERPGGGTNVDLVANGS